MLAAAVALLCITGGGAARAQAAASTGAGAEAESTRLAITALGCARGVQLTSRGVPLSQLLQRLSQTLEFKLEYWAKEDPLITLDLQRHPTDLMQALATRANLMVRYVKDRRCPAHHRIDTVWVLPIGAPAPAMARGAAAATPAQHQPLPMTDSPDIVLRAHGITDDAAPPAAGAPAASAGAPGAAGSGAAPRKR
jgi:hypothetical protein